VNDEAPPLLVGGLPPPAMKVLTAAFLLYSSSTSRLFLFRMNRYNPPAIALMATMPTTTPAAMAALLGPPFAWGDAEALADVESDEPGACVITTVDPGAVTTDGVVAVVSEGEVVEDGAADDVLESSAEAVGALEATPLSQTLQKFWLEPHISDP